MYCLARAISPQVEYSEGDNILANAYASPPSDLMVKQNIRNSASIIVYESGFEYLLFTFCLHNHLQQPRLYSLPHLDKYNHTNYS